MIGARCADLIAEAVVAMEFRASAEDFKNVTCASYICRSNKRSGISTDNRPLRIIENIVYI
jgi:dihydrolipoamide dehydrogenase